MAEHLDLEAIRARVTAATRGPWHAEYFGKRGYPQRIGTDDATVVAETFDGGGGPAANAEFIAHARQDIPALLAEVQRLRDALAAYVGPDRHVIEFRADGWTIQHPLACRPNLFDCPVNRVAERELTEPPISHGRQVLGRFECDVNGGADRLLIFDRSVR